MSHESMDDLRRLVGGGGGFANFKIVDVIQMCCIGQKTGRLHVRSHGKEGAIYIHAGSVVHAEAPGLEGEEAVYAMITWDEAQSSLDETVSSHKATISTSWEHLLMEGVRRKDEHGKIGGHDLRREADAEDLIGKMLGTFRIRRKLASDQLGTLYEALQVALNRPVALKVLSPSFYEDEEQVQQFIAFASAMAQAQSPYITMVYEAGQGDGLIFYAREHVDETNLKEHLERGFSLSEDLALRVILNVGEALKYERKNDILHAPLSIEQVLIPTTGVPKLLNNVTLEGGEISEGEIDEIRSLGAIVEKGISGASAVSPELKDLLGKMLRAGEGGFNDWDALLHEAHQLDLNRRATLSASSILPSEVSSQEPKPQIALWMMGTVVGIVLIGLIYLFLHRPNPTSPQSKKSKVTGSVSITNTAPVLTAPSSPVSEPVVTPKETAVQKVGKVVESTTIINTTPVSEPVPVKESVAPKEVVVKKADGKNVVLNGGFEEGEDEVPTNWTRGFEAGTPMFAWEKEGHSGKRSLSIATRETEDIGHWMQTIPVKPHTNYKVRLWYRMASKSPERCSFLQVRIGGGDKIIVDWPLHLTLDWTEFSGTFSSENMQTIDVYLYLFQGGKQKVWFDDLEIIEEQK